MTQRMHEPWKPFGALPDGGTFCGRCGTEAGPWPCPTRELEVRLHEAYEYLSQGLGDCDEGCECLVQVAQAWLADHAAVQS